MKHSLVRDTIIETASNLFYKNGYNLTGINEIIKEAGIAKATLYNHFSSKEDICLAYLKHKNATFLKEIETFALKSPKGEHQLMALFDFLELFFKGKNFNGCWCIRTVAEIPMENEAIRTEIQHQKNQFLTLISTLVETNMHPITSNKSKSLARQVYVLYEGAVAESHLHQDAWPIVSAKEICAKILA
jgi:AcrR family transcriptional regulator